MVMLCTALVAACGSRATGTVTNVYQKLVSGPVHTYLAVELEDGTTVEVQLPDDETVWNVARNSVGWQVDIKSAGDTYAFVDFVD